MWPWEHAAVAYLAYSLLVRLARGRPPTGPEAITVVIASVFPDLIDKPLAWEFGVFDAGYGIAHSVLVAVPVSAVVTYLLSLRGRLSVGVAVAVGWLLHLPADLFVGYVQEGDVPLSRVLWPVQSAEATYEGGFTGTLTTYLGNYVQDLLSGSLDLSAVVGLGAFGLCLLMWLIDGAPGVKSLVEVLR
jgi:hypothetical protein